MAAVFERLPAVLDVAKLPPDTAIVVVRGSRLDAVFPYVELAQLGCASETVPAEHLFAWTLFHDFPDADRLFTHGMMTGISVQLRAEGTPTEARLDSAFQRKAIAVWTVRHVNVGDLRTVETHLVEPEGRAVYFDHGRLHFVMKGDTAVYDFVRAGTNRIRLTWCAHARARSEITVPLLRR
jgi:hypothetical protein